MAADLLQWVVELNTGVEQVDHEHMILVDSINDVILARESGDKAKTLSAMKKLAEVVAWHFRNEEAILKEQEYSLFEPHVKVHHGFEAKVAGFIDRYELDDSAADELIHLLRVWLFMHISHHDMGWNKEFQTKGKDLSKYVPLK